MRWSQGAWSERMMIGAVEGTERYFPLPYGPSGTAPEGDIRAFEQYFERLDAAGLGKVKRPDLLVFRAGDRQAIEAAVSALGGVSELPFTREEDPRMAPLLTRAVLAVECENSLWVAKQMPDYGAELRPQKRLQNQPGLKKTAVLPTVIVKEEDRAPLVRWQEAHHIPVHVWHAFYDLAFGIAFDEIQRLISTRRIEATAQVFQAPGGATTKKVIYKIYYHYAYPLAESREEPRLVAKQITDKNGHILPYVHFEGGRFALRDEARARLDQLSEARP